MTTENKAMHSPLPWRAVWCGVYRTDKKERIAECVRDSMRGYDDDEIAKADAALIVEAVNAYGLLQSALSFTLNSLEEITDPHGGYFITGPMYERSKEAMKCARAALGREANDGRE